MAQVQSNLSGIKSELERKMKVAANVIGGMMERYAKESLTASKAVDTGLLRNSVTYGIEGEAPHIGAYKADHGPGTGNYSGSIPKTGTGDSVTVVVGTNVFYAPFIELGTRRMKARPYLRPAIEGHQAQYKDVLEKALKNG